MYVVTTLTELVLREGERGERGERESKERERRERMSGSSRKRKNKAAPRK